MTVLQFGATAIAVTSERPPFVVGDRVRYVPPDGKVARITTGTLQAISGASALVKWDALGWVGGAPLERLTLEAQRPAIGAQLSLV